MIFELKIYLGEGGIGSAHMLAATLRQAADSIEKKTRVSTGASEIPFSYINHPANGEAPGSREAPGKPVGTYEVTRG